MIYVTIKTYGLFKGTHVNLLPIALAMSASLDALLSDRALYVREKAAADLKGALQCDKSDWAKTGARVAEMFAPGRSWEVCLYVWAPLFLQWVTARAEVAS